MSLRLLEEYGEMPRADREYWWTHSAERVAVLSMYTDAELSRRRYN